jgi:hypothetical protein
MKQSTKVLLPLGLFMSIVIPVTVKSLFTDSAFLEASENSKIDYSQPYQVKPEVRAEILQLDKDENTGEIAAERSNSSNHINEKESLNPPQRRLLEKDLSLPAEALTLDEMQAAEQSGALTPEDRF